MPYVKHDAQPPSSWPSDISYIVKSRLSPGFPASLLPHIHLVGWNPSRTKYDPKPILHPGHLAIKRISDPSHPAHGQAGLFAKKKIGPAELIIPYLGIIHHSLNPADNVELDEAHSSVGTGNGLEHERSDYDLSLVRISAPDALNPYPGYHVSIGVDANTAGNAARFVNDYRGIGSEPNAEFRLGHGAVGELRMEIWSLKKGVGKGDEVLVSYGKSWWSARK